MSTPTEFSSRFLEHLPLVRKIAFDVARRKRLSEEEAEELASQLQWRLVRDDYRALRSFRFESSFQTFLAVIARRTATDLLRERLGNWRPSALAKRTGIWAERYETFRQRDGATREEARAQVLREGLEISDEEIDRLEAAWPERPGRHFVGAEALLAEATPDPGPEQLALERERAERRSWALGVLRDACASLPTIDRWLLEQFYAGATAEQLSRLLPDRPERRQLFYRIEKLRDQLRTRLEAAGVDRETVRELFRGSWTEFGEDDRL